MFGYTWPTRRDIRYSPIKDIVRERIKQVDITQTSDIFVYLDYPFGWHAIFGAFDPISNDFEVDVLFCIGGRLHWEVHPLLGFNPDGSPIVYPRTKPLFEELDIYLSRINKALEGDNNQWHKDKRYIQVIQMALKRKKKQQRSHRQVLKRLKLKRNR